MDLSNGNISERGKIFPSKLAAPINQPCQCHKQNENMLEGAGWVATTFQFRQPVKTLTLNIRRWKKKILSGCIYSECKTVPFVEVD